MYPNAVSNFTLMMLLQIKLCLIHAQTAIVAIVTRLPATVIRVEEGTRHLFCMCRIQDTALSSQPTEE